MPDGVVSSMDKCKFKSKNGGSRREEHNHPHQPLAVADQFLLKGEIDRAWIEYVSAFRAKSKKGIKNKDLQKLISLLWRRVYPLRPHVLPEAGGDQNTLDVTQSQRELLRCPKCRGILFEPSTLRCGHTFCMRCLKEKKNNKQRSSSSSGTNSAQDCQTCREAINYQRLEYPLKLNTVVNTVLTKWFESEIECVRLRLEGNDFFNKEQYDAALRRYTKAHNLCPCDYLVLGNRSHTFASLKMFQNAFDDAAKVCQLQPSWVKGHFRKGVALSGLKKHQEAAAAYLQCLVLDATTPGIKALLSQELYLLLQDESSERPQQRVQIHDLQIARELIKERPVEEQQIPMEEQQECKKPNGCENKTVQMDQGEENRDDSKTMRVEEQQVDDSNNNNKETPMDQQQECKKHKNYENKDVAMDQEEKYEGGHCENEKVLMEDLQGQSQSYNAMGEKEVLMEEQQQENKYSRMRPDRDEAIACCSTEDEVRCSQQIDISINPLKYIIDSCMALYEAIKNAKPINEIEVSEEKIRASLNDFMCPLCYRLFHEPVTTSCGHVFCKSCLDRCFDHGPKCPMCRTDLSPSVVLEKRKATVVIERILKTLYPEEYQERQRIYQDEIDELARIATETPNDVPIFVCTLTLPTLRCPLHVFEPRYRLMIRQCLESNSKQFGMCVYNTEQGYADYGVMLEIQNVTFLTDGRFLVDTIGGRRFRVIQRGSRDGYNTAKVEWIKDLEIQPEQMNQLKALHSEVYSLGKIWFQALPDFVQRGMIATCGDIPQCDEEPALAPHGPNWTWWLAHFILDSINTQLNFLATTSLQTRLQILRERLNVIC